VTAGDAELLNDLGVVRYLASQTFRRVDQIEDALLAATEHQARLRQQRKAGSAQVVIVCVQLRFVTGSEGIDERDARPSHAEFQQRIPEIARSVPLAILSGETGVAGGIDGRCTPSLPDTAAVHIRRNGEDANPRERRGIEGRAPSVIGSGIFMRAPGDRPSARGSRTAGS